MIRELLSSGSKEEDKEVRKKKAKDMAWTSRKRDAMIRGLLSSNSQEKEIREEEKTKWNKDVAMKDLLEGSYDKEVRNPEDDKEWYKKIG
jgi:hypothetical protein